MNAILYLCSLLLHFAQTDEDHVLVITWVIRVGNFYELVYQNVRQIAQSENLDSIFTLTKRTRDFFAVTFLRVLS